MSDRRTSILLVGATGFIGSHVTTALVDAGFDVHMTFYESTSISDSNCSDRCTTHQIDITDRNKTQAVVDRAGPDVVCNLSAYGVQRQETDVGKMLAVNSRGPVTLYKAAMEADVDRVIQTGSCFEYGGQPGKISESVSPDPVRPYGTTKSTATRLLQQIGHDGQPVLVLRPFGVYGEGESSERLFPTLARQLMAGKSVDLSHGSQIRDFVYVGDVARAFVSACTADLDRGVTVVNLGTGNGHTVAEVAREFTTQANVPESKLNFGAYDSRQNQRESLVADPHKAMDVLGWEAEVSLSDGVEKMLEANE